jgi:PAS domain S-box-containing protein
MLETDAIETKGTFRKFLNVLPQIAWIADPSGEICFYNHKWHSYTGLSESQSGKEACKNIVHPEDLPELEKKYVTALQTEDSFTTECRYKRGDGQYRWHFIRVSAIRNDQDEIYLWVVISTDIHDRKRSREELQEIATDAADQALAREKIQESEERFRLMVQQAPVAMLVFRGEDMIFEIVNDAMLLLVGRDQSIVGKPALEAMPELESQSVWQVVKNVYHTGESYFGNEVPVQIVKNGIAEQGYYTFSYVPLKEHDKTVGILHVAIDVTTQVKAKLAAEETTRKIETAVVERTKELAEANDSLQRSNAELAQFAYIASHDLQEPLRKISTFSQMLEHSLGNINETSRNYLDRIKDSTSRMAKLVKDVLGYSQLGNNEEMLEMVNLQQIVEGIKTDYELMIEQKNATISCAGLPTIQAIPLQMSQLFGNLLSNSLKYASTTARPVITISASLVPQEELRHFFSPPLETDYYKIEFKDNGIGFKQEYADRIFNIFQRLHGKMEFAGTGIGLAMCQKIVQNHHGKISAKGKLEQGSTFIILLPSKQK